MTLKKTDKIIAVIGVLIIVISGIGIFYYAVNQEETDEGPETGEVKTIGYNINWTEFQGSSDKKTISIEKKFLNPGKQITIIDKELCTLPVNYLKSVDFNITYKDTATGLIGLNALFKSIGKDTLTVTITDPDGTTYEKSINGNEIISIDGKNNLENTFIEAESLEDAELQLQEMYPSNWKDANFTLSYTFKARGLLERLSKDTFSVEITYSYYDYTIEEVKGQENQDNDDGDIITENNDGKQTWIAMSYPGYH